MLLPIITVLCVGITIYCYHVKRKKQALYNLNKPDLSKKSSLNVIVTGATRGIGFALAKRFLQKGDHVVICSRSQRSVDEAVSKLEQVSPNRVFGISCDISKEQDIVNLAKFAQEKLTYIDLWVNNAGSSGNGYATLDNFPEDKITEIVNANVLGTLLNAKIAIRVFKEQPNGGQLYTYFEGAGSNGWATPHIAPYGTTKYGLFQLNKSLVEETKNTKVGIHHAQPGMVMTQMLVNSAANPRAKKIFNILAEEAHVVANFMVERMRKTKGTSGKISFLTTFEVLFRFATWWKRKNRFYNEKGELRENMVV